MKYIKEELEQLIFIDKLSYREIGRQYKVSDTYIKKICSKLGITLSIRHKFPEGFIPANKGKLKNKIKCLQCGNDCDIYAKKFCSEECCGKYRKISTYNNYINNQKNYCRASYSPKIFKLYFLEDQNHQCAICKIPDIWNNKQLIFVLDHIDGRADNNMRDNLRLICHNCDSQLDTYKSKNKNSARSGRYLKNYKQK